MLFPSLSYFLLCSKNCPKNDIDSKISFISERFSLLTNNCRQIVISSVVIKLKISGVLYAWKFGYNNWSLFLMFGEAKPSFDNITDIWCLPYKMGWGQKIGIDTVCFSDLGQLNLLMSIEFLLLLPLPRNLNSDENCQKWLKNN